MDITSVIAVVTEIVPQEQDSEVLQTRQRENVAPPTQNSMSCGYIAFWPIETTVGGETDMSAYSCVTVEHWCKMVAAVCSPCFLILKD